MTEEPEVRMILPEAPASVNFKARTSKGYDMMFTLRDVDEIALLNRLAEFFGVIEEKFHITPTGRAALATTQPAAENVSHDPLPEFPNADPGYCQIHNTAMTRHEKDGQHWYSHKVGDDWCKGK